MKKSCAARYTSPLERGSPGRAASSTIGEGRHDARKGKDQEVAHEVAARAQKTAHFSFFLFGFFFFFSLFYLAFNLTKQPGISYNNREEAPFVFFCLTKGASWNLGSKARRKLREVENAERWIEDKI
jgi:hypothetical protein